MADTPTEEAQESTQLFDTLRRSGFKASDAHYTIKSIEEMASANLIHRFERIQNVKFNMILWMLGVLITAVLGVFGYLLTQA